MYNSNLLDESERIENLSDDAIKDIWVRMKLWSKHRKRIMRRGEAIDENPFDSKYFHQAMEQLKLTEEGSTIFGFVRDHYSLDVQNKLSGKGIEDALFDHMTNDDYDGDKIEAARKSIKRSVNGGTGMPMHKLIRENIKKWEELEEVEH